MRVDDWNGRAIRFVERSGEWRAVAVDFDAASYPSSNGVSQRRKVTVINEFGAYRLIFQSRMPESESFRKWAFQIIKELRKSLGLSECEAFRLMDKEHQKAAMRKLAESLRDPVKVDYIKANVIADKAVSAMHGFTKMVRKADMDEGMLRERESVLADVVDLMAASGRRTGNTRRLLARRREGRLEMIINTGLFQNAVCGVAFVDFSIHSEVSVCYGTVPNVVVTFAMAHKAAAVLRENLADFFLVFRHYAKAFALRSAMKRKITSFPRLPFRERISGATYRHRSISKSRDPASRASGMSSLMASHRWASSSHVKVMVYSFIADSFASRIAQAELEVKRGRAVRWRVLCFGVLEDQAYYGRI
jgi:prophage antirepressor-like protein